MFQRRMGFAREAMDLSLFNKETEQAWTLKVMRDEILSDLFQPLLKKEGSKTTLGYF